MGLGKTYLLLLASSLKLEGLAMGTSSYAEIPLTHWVDFTVTVAGISRTVQVVLVPKPAPGLLDTDEHELLLVPPEKLPLNRRHQ